MTDPRYSYDENADVWPYFVLTLLLTVLVPVTMSKLKGLANVYSFSRRHPHEIRRPDSAYNYREQLVFEASRKRRSVLDTTTAILLCGWIFVLLLVLRVKSQPVPDIESNRFDPWELLEISTSATAKEIKRAYRKLSLTMHPDKIRDITGEARKVLEARYVDISKAYQALTDEDTRQNFLQYGHPDGPQQMSHGIGLPSFLVGSGSAYVVFAYILGFGLFVPWAVGSWWARQKSYTRWGLLQDTAFKMFEIIVKEQPPFISSARILDVILESAELDAELPKVSRKQRKKLLKAYLSRSPVENEYEKLVVVSVAMKLLEGMLVIASEFKNAVLIERLIMLQRCIYQAVAPEDMARGAQLQIPGVDISKIDESGNPIVPEESFELARQFLPKIKLLEAKFRMPSENAVYPSSQVFIACKFLVVPYGSPFPEVSKAELEALDIGVEYTSLKDVLVNNDKIAESPNAVSTHYPLQQRAMWYGLLVGERDNRTVQAPVEINRVDFSNFTLSKAELENGKNITIGIFYMPVQPPSPPGPGSYSFRLELLSAQYFGADVYARVTMDVVAPSEVTEPTEEEEFSDTEKNSDEDSSEEEGLSDLDTDTEPETEEDSDVAKGSPPSSPSTAKELAEKKN